MADEKMVSHRIRQEDNDKRQDRIRLQELEHQFELTGQQEPQEEHEPPLPGLTEALEKAKACGEELSMVLSHAEGKAPKSDLPLSTWGHIDSLFSGELHNLRQWSRDRVNDGLYAHIVLILVQEFRNSPEAEKLARVYNASSKDERVICEEQWRMLIPDRFLFDMLFKLPLRPFIIDPRADPANTAEVRKMGEQEYFTVRDALGRTVMTGCDAYPAVGVEASCGYLYTGDARESRVRVEYYCNIQPCLALTGTGSHSDRWTSDLFKTYLSAKGRMLFYQYQGEKGGYKSAEEQLTIGQCWKLKEFFRWERGDKGDALLKLARADENIKTAEAEVEKAFSRLAFRERAADNADLNKALRDLEARLKALDATVKDQVVLEFNRLWAKYSFKSADGDDRREREFIIQWTGESLKLSERRPQ